MTDYLLDTHILLWSLLAPDKLSWNVATELDNAENELWLSPITTWEIMILSEKSRIQLDAAPDRWMEQVFRSFPLKEAVLNHEVAMVSRKIRLPHNDPADRFIAATCSVYGLTLVTADVHLIKNAAGYTVLPNH